ncbi:MAG: FkbM family methyltransferase [Patescibacteria group bacterium]
MLYSSFSSNPRFTKHLVSEGVFKNNPLTVVDVGARGGPEYHWVNYGDAVRFIGFEPDKGECERLNRDLGSGSATRFYPAALYSDKGTHTFYEQVSSAAGGLCPRDPKIVNRFPTGELFKITGTSQIKTTTFDSFAEDYKIPEVDFIKTDAEGADFDVVKGSVSQIKKSVLGISSEIHFAPWCGEGKGFSELEQLLRPLGFKLYDINFCRFANKAFPSIDSVLPGGCGVSSYGQIIFAQAIFFRDPVAEIEDKKLLSSDWDATRVLKAASLFEVFGLPDCAIELLGVAEKYRIINDSEKINIEKFRDLITSGFLGRTITYRQHLQKLLDIKKRGYFNNYERFKPYFKKVPYLAKIRSFVKKQIAQRHNNYSS